MEPYERLKYLRKNVFNLEPRRFWNQEDFASKVNLSRSNLSNVESNKVKLTGKVINDICDAFLVNRSWPLNREEPVFLDGGDPFVSEIVDIRKTLNEDNRKYLKGYVCRLAEEQKA